MLHRYRRGQGFELRRSLNFFHACFSQRKSCVHNGDDLPSYDNDSDNNNDNISVPRRQKTDLMVIMILMIHGGLSIAAKKG